MNSTVQRLDQVISDLSGVLCDDVLAGLSDAERVEVLQRAGAAFRRAEAVVVETLATADAVGFPHAVGCRNATELLQRTVRVEVRSATRVGTTVTRVRRESSLVSGERLPARWPHMREALLDGVVGVAGFLAATGPIEKVWDRLTTDQRLAADLALAGAARGHGLAPVDDPDGDDPDASDVDDADEAADAEEGVDDDGPAPTTDDLSSLGEGLASIFDPDGEEPKDEDARRRRGVTIGRLKNGLHAIRGYLTPEVAAQLLVIMDAILNPKGPGAPMPGVFFTPSDTSTATNTGDTGDTSDPETAGDTGDTGAHFKPADSDSDGSASDGSTDDVSTPDPEEDPFNSDPRNVFDDRTTEQKRHDALAAALAIAARHTDMPTLGGAAPTVVVTVDATDLATGTGWATIARTGAHLPVSVAAQAACSGAIQRVLFDEGRIIGITSTDRVFTVHQRRAIIARDKECLIPGCHVPASWCEIHHVTEHAHGGPTHTDNGVPLCWWHHRSLGTSLWEIRMNNGLPQVRGPGWWDPAHHWRTPRHSTPADSTSPPGNTRQHGLVEPGSTPPGNTRQHNTPPVSSPPAVALRRTG
ncbi:HNH endonuclease signature motif containing protein [Microbacterium hydrocarbonoxydans]|uniref:HNH nuclease domain-containing protein n=1 Tax=Microbacterium hydrocarbonoxydans TaxID=273678 RepID=A0A1H4PBS5_9MICO|nr:HNH endonuclease signature motif containing protein [Microbacterium hydrocarbonoxydans]SEC04859.1 protein of unknown function [Microbacterium hydrocarbonoxydans]